MDHALVELRHLDFEIASCGVSVSAIPAHYELVSWANVVNYHFPWPYADVLYFLGNHFRGKNRKPAVITYHSDIVRQRALNALYRPLMNQFLGAADRIICTSPNYLATSDVLSDHQERVEVIPIGIDEASYPDADLETTERIRREFGSNFFLFIGVLRYYKGLHILLDAVVGTELRVVIAGSGPIECELKEQAARMRLDNVQFAGYVSDSDKVALIRESRGIVFPSYLRAEAFGVTLLEGAMHGKPLISTEVGSGTSHVNIDGETGIVVEPGDPGALRDAMLMLDQNQAQATAFGNNARRRFQERFTGSLMGERYQALYQRVLDEQPTAPPQSVDDL